MAYPRKFREKIALHTQKQAEETAAFEAILREVSASTRQAATSSSLKPVQSQMARSLPNVNQMVNSQSIDLKNALSGVEEIKKELERGSRVQHRDRGSNQPQRPLSRDRQRASSPYGSVNYLSLPSAENNWRRASSDPSLHSSVSALQPVTDSVQLLTAANSGKTASDVNYGCKLANLLSQPPQVPSVSFGSSFDNSQCGANSGSLPDLTNLNFPPPLSTPLDVSESINDNVMNNQRGGGHRHAPLAPLMFSKATNNHLLAGGCAVVTNTQCKSPPRSDVAGGVFSPLSPQPIITLTDASFNANGGREEILYSEDWDAIQDYLLNTNSPMVSLSPGFFRQPSGGPTPPSLFSGNLHSATGGPFFTNVQQSNSMRTSFQDSKSVCDVNNMPHNGVMSAAEQQPQQQTLMQWNQLQHELQHLQQQQSVVSQHSVVHQLQDKTGTCIPQLQQQSVQQQQQQQQLPQQLQQSVQHTGLIYQQQQLQQQVLLPGQLQQPGAEVERGPQFVGTNERPPPPYSDVSSGSGWDLCSSLSSVDVGNDLMTSSTGNILSTQTSSFDLDLLVPDDALTFGLNPLALEDLQLLSDTGIITDLDTENSFRRDRNYNDYRLM